MRAPWHSTNPLRLSLLPHTGCRATTALHPPYFDGYQARGKCPCSRRWPSSNGAIGVLALELSFIVVSYYLVYQSAKRLIGMIDPTKDSECPFSLVQRVIRHAVGLEKEQVENDMEKIQKLVALGKLALKRHVTIQTWAASQPKLVDFFTLEEKEQKEIIDDILLYIWSRRGRRRGGRK